MFGFSKKKFQVNLSPRKKKPVITAPPQVAPLRSRRIQLFLLACVFAFLVYMVTFGSFAMHPMSPTSQQTQSDIDFAQSTATNTIQLLVEEVNKQYLLPVGETPTMALITSLDELKDQKFFAKAQIGDIVLMYMEAQKAILWRPTTKQIIEIGPISVSTPSPDAMASTTASSSQEKTH